MSQLAANQLLSEENINPPTSAAARVSGMLLGLGTLGVAGTIVGSFVVGQSYAMASWHAMAMAALAITLGAMFWVMIFHLTMSGWSITLRRQFENLMKMMPIAIALVAPVLIIEIISGGVLFKWMNPAVTAGDPVFASKQPYLNIPFFVIRWMIFVTVWMFLSTRLWNLSTRQDITGDKWLSNKARFTSSWGMPLFALTTAFAAFDWLMSLDYHFFSTMWGVYYFAGGVFSSIATIIVMLFFIQRTGRLEGLVTNEHRHDLGKLLFGFTVFWSYIAFSQYFLIWYSNIPEETAFMVLREQHGWRYVTLTLMWGHFIVPFVILLFAGIKRNKTTLTILAVWMLLMHLVDLFWIVLPNIHVGELRTVNMSGLWVNVSAALGVFGIYFGLLARRVASGPLVPLKDPRMPESLHHRNYV